MMLSARFYVALTTVSWPGLFRPSTIFSHTAKQWVLRLRPGMTPENSD
jgi:hypothetical protein